MNKCAVSAIFFLSLYSGSSLSVKAAEAPGPAAVLTAVVQQMVTEPVPEYLAQQVDWDSVLRATPARFAESQGIENGPALKELYLEFLRNPSKVLMKPLQPLISECLPQEKETVDRMVAAYESMNGWMVEELNEGLHSWKDAAYEIGEAGIDGDMATVKLRVGDGRCFSDLSVNMVHVNGRWLLKGEWLPGLLNDIIEETGSRPESKTAGQAMNYLYRRREEIRSGL